MSQSYFFAVIPRHLKPEHSFAKTIKPNTNYRLVLYKGIQKCDQMKQPIKSKLVGGKIDLQSPEMFFSVQFYSPLKNIQFTLKLYEEKPNEPQTQIASAVIMSGDYIKNFKNDQGTSYLVDAKLKDDLAITFDLVVEKSKYSLTDAMKKIGNTPSKPAKQVVQENRSQSSRSKQFVREGDGFISPRKKISRKSGHKGKLRSRNNSRSEGEVSPQGSVASSRRRWRKSPPSKEGEHFMHSPKKASPPKVNSPAKVADSQKGKSIPKSQTSLKSLQQKIDLKPEVNQKSYNYKPAGNLKFQSTKEIFDIKVDRNSPGFQSPVATKQNIVEKPSVAKSTIVSPPVKSSGIQSPTPSQSAVRQATSPSSLPVSPKSTTTLPTQVKQTPSKQPMASPKSSKNAVVDLEVNHSREVFDIVQKRTYPSPSQSSSNYQYQPPKTSPKVQGQRNGQRDASPEKKEQIVEKDVHESRGKSVKMNESVKVNMKRTDSVQVQNPIESKANNSRSRLQASGQKGVVQESKVNIKMQGSIHEPEAVVISREERSQKNAKSIEVKAKEVKNAREWINENGASKGSIQQKQVEGGKKLDQESKVALKASEQRKQLVLYVLFLGVSLFLIYLAMTPTRRV